MTRVILDTNLVVSAILSPEGKPARILKMAFDGRLDLAISSALLNEITLVLNYQKIRKLLAKHGIHLEEIKDVLQRIVKTAFMTPGKLDVGRIDRDPSDNMILACAVEGRADFIVSGDRHLTDLVSFEGVSIVNPDTFLKLIESK
ncbi:MAG: putative toxin-antitoxin system toxin component, PIN family [Syntrophorhabdales bacterium]|jgi:putative PIN family toxin of toxin-antitoxin system